MFGFRTEDYESPEVEVWPENWPALDLYVRNHTQIIVGVNGIVGLNYPWFWSRIDRMGVDQEEAEHIMDGVRMIEDIVLDLIGKDK